MTKPVKSSGFPYIYF